MAEHFGNKQFMRFQAQGFEQYPLRNAYEKEEGEFYKTIKVVPISELPTDANIVNSHVLYKVKHNDDQSLKLKARIAPHGNEDDIRNTLTKDCASCPPTGIRTVQSIATLKRWKLVLGDVKSAFLKTGEAERDVYVKPPQESKMRTSHVWLLMVAAYGLVNSNAKWQHKSDQALINLGLSQSKHIPQLFYKIEKGELTMVIAKVVDDIIAAGIGNTAEQLLSDFGKQYELGKMESGPGNFRFFGINISQNDDLSIESDADDKLEGLFEYSLLRNRRKQQDGLVNKIEKSAFMSTNSSIGWIGTAASPLCSYYARHLQQKAPYIKVKHIIEQNNILRKLKRFVTSIKYPRPTLNVSHEISIAVFANASRIDENGQIGVLAGLLIGELTEGAVFYTLLWLSHKSRRPVKSVPAAEILAAAEGIDEEKMLAATYSEFLGVQVKLRVYIDSKDLFSSLSTQRVSVDRSIRSDVSCIRYEFQTGNVNELSWITGKLNLSDPLTKADSSLTESLQLLLSTGHLWIDIKSAAESKSADVFLG